MPTKQQTNKMKLTIKPKKYSVTDSRDVRNLPALFENKVEALIVKMIKSLLWGDLERHVRCNGAGCL